jgi:hypothetical protein
VQVSGAFPPENAIPAPALRETADIWWDSGTDPLVTWDDEGRRFLLVDGAGAGTLTLWTAPAAVDDPAAIARALAEGLAACDFPPTGDGAHPAHVAAALRAAGLPPAGP